MAEPSLNRDRVAVGGMISRATVAAADGLAGWSVSVGLSFLTYEVCVLVAELLGRDLDASSSAFRFLGGGEAAAPTLAFGLLVGLCVSLAALVHADWTAGGGGTIRRAVGLKVVDARTYASIGFVQALFRVAVRELVFVTVAVVSAPAVLDRLPAPGVGRTWYVLGWLAACRFAPPALAWFLPRGRGVHDLVAGTVVIATGPGSRPPVVEAVLVSRHPVSVA